MANKISTKELLDAGVHFGHLTRKWDPRMAPYIFMERNGIHIIDVNKTAEALETAMSAIQNIARSGRKIMFVSTKKQSHAIVNETARALKMPYVTERWLGGMLTNFSTVRKSIKRMTSIEKMQKESDFESSYAKKERLMLSREKDKLERIIGGIADLNRLPAALFIIDVKKEHIAVKEAKRLNLPIFALVDTNSNPDSVDFPIPGNDDSAKSIEIIIKYISKAIEDGLSERKKDKDASEEESQDPVIKVNKPVAGEEGEVAVAAVGLKVKKEKKIVAAKPTKRPDSKKR